MADNIETGKSEEEGQGLTSSRNGVPNHGGSVDAPVAGIGHHDGVAGQDDDQKGQGVEGARQAAVVGKDARHADDEEAEDGDGQVQQLSRGDAPGM